MCVCVCVCVCEREIAGKMKKLVFVIVYFWSVDLISAP